MHLGAFVNRIQDRNGVAASAVREELVAAARTTVAEVLGAGPRVEALWSTLENTVELRQVVTVVEHVTQPYRELAVATLGRLGGRFADVVVGEEMELSLFFHEEDAEAAAEIDAMFGGLLALSSLQRSLQAPLEEAWIQVVQRHLPPRVWPDDSAGSLLQRGGWLTGTRATANDVTLSIAKTTWKERPSSPDDATVRAGFELRIERRGRSLDLPRERTFTLGEVRRWAGTPAPESRRAAVEADLAAAAGQLAGESSIDRLDAALVDRILASILGFPV